MAKDSNTYPEVEIHSMNVAETSVVASLIEDETYLEQYNRADAFCKEYLPEEMYREMRTKDFLIGQPRPTNDDEFECLDKMFAEIEAEGDSTEEEIRQMMSI